MTDRDVYETATYIANHADYFNAAHPSVEVEVGDYERCIEGEVIDVDYTALDRDILHALVRVIGDHVTDSGDWETGLNIRVTDIASGFSDFGSSGGVWVKLDKTGNDFERGATLHRAGPIHRLEVQTDGV